MKIFEQIKNFLFPRYCLFCGVYGKNICFKCLNEKFLYRGLQTCPKCFGLLPKGKYIHKICKKNSSLDGVFIVLNYEKNIMQALTELKYHFYEDFAKNLSELILTKAQSLKIKIDYLVPVPLHKSKFNWRGFNQSEALLELLPWSNPPALIRKKNTNSQAKLNRKQRLNNLFEAFEINPQINILNSSLLLFDDVMTTSTTLEACAKVLKNHGAKYVYGLVLAKDNRDFSKTTLQ